MIMNDSTCLLPLNFEFLGPPSFFFFFWHQLNFPLIPLCLHQEHTVKKIIRICTIIIIIIKLLQCTIKTTNPQEVVLELLEGS